ncbi:TPR domain protein [Apiospora saccharicola]|uniref:TPR domain protein n=1 Tax=Apiospora saccharicola TaxID=335842 RepID=A0ABR1VBC6_9PEZI
MDQNQFSQLYHGDYEVVSAKPLVDGQPVVDTFHVAEVIAVSGMGAPQTSIEAFRDKGDESHAAYASCGPWPLASRMNHSCLPNCRRSFIGDMLIVRATRDLSAGAELDISYRGGSRALTASDREWLKSTWGFTCECELCISSPASPPDTLWHMLESLDRMSKAMPIDGAQAAKANISNAGKLLSQMRATWEYTDLDRNVRRSSNFNLDHAEFRVKLASILLRMGNPWDAIKMALRGLRLLGFDIASPPLKEGAKAKPEFCVRRWGVATDSALDAFLPLLKAYKSAAPSLLPMLRPYALKVYSMVVGEESTAADEFLEFDPEIK